jgi:hypothetical protein
MWAAGFRVCLDVVVGMSVVSLPYPHPHSFLEAFSEFDLSKLPRFKML